MQYRKHLGTCIALTSVMLLCPACQDNATERVSVRDNDVLETDDQRTMTPPHEEESTPSFDTTTIAPLHARVASPRWAERKLAQRALLHMTGEQRTASAAELATRAMDATDAKGTQRLLVAALSLNPDAALSAIVADLETATAPVRDAALRVLVRSEHVDLQPLRDTLVALGTSMADQASTPASAAIGLALLAKIGDASATERISLAINAKDKTTRKSGMSVLQRWAVPGGLDLALAALKTPEVYVRRRAAAALAMYPSSPAALDALASLLRTETNTRVCTRGLEALAAFPGAQVEPLLVERLVANEGCAVEHTFVSLAVARRVLRRSSAPLASLRSAIATVASGPSLFGVKAAAIVALGDVEMAKKIQGVDAIDALSELTSKSLESTETRMAAVAALGALNTQEATSRLYRVLEDAELSPTMVSATLVAIEESGHADQERMTALVPFTTEHEAAEIRSLAVSHLARNAQDSTSASRLLALRSDRDPAVMEAANRGIQRLFEGADVSTSSAINAQLNVVDTRHRQLQEAEAARAAVVLADAHRAHADEDHGFAAKDTDELGEPSESWLEATANPQPPVGEPPTAPVADRLQP